MTATTRLLTIELRRNVALWLVPLIVGFSWYNFRSDFQLPVVLWLEASGTISLVGALTGPFVGGAAAWMAGRERRRGMDELLTTTACPPTRRGLILWAATVGWGVIGFVVAALGFIAVTASRATWDQPYPWLLAVGLLTVFAHAAVGYAIGRWLPSRFTAPLTAIALFGAEVYVAEVMASDTILPVPSHSDLEPARYLSPLATTNRDVWYGIQPDVAQEQSLWLAGVTAVALVVAILRTRRSARVWAAFVGSALLVAVGATQTIQAAADQGPWWMSIGEQEPQPVTLVCSDDAFAVCVHPAYTAWLDDISGLVNQIGAPVVGLPGMPSRAEQTGSYAMSQRMGEQAIVPFSLSAYEDGERHAVGEIVSCLVRHCLGGGGPMLEGSLPAQDAVGYWLWEEADRPDLDTGWWWSSNCYEPAVCAAAERLGALSPEEQRAWLEANFADLRAGRVTLEDLP